MHTLPSLLAASLLVTTALSGSIVISFDAASDLNSFTPTDPANWSVASGVLSAAKDTTLGTINGAYYNSPFLLANDTDTLTLSVAYTSWAGANMTANGFDAIRLGIDPGTSDALPDFSGVLRGNASGNRNHRVGNYSGTNLVASSSSTNLPNSAQTFVLQTVFTRVSPTELSMSTTLFNATQSSAVISTLDRLVSVSAGYFDVPLHAGLFLNGDASPAAAAGISVDNFTMTLVSVPEPSTYAALLGAAGLALVHFRRRAVA